MLDGNGRQVPDLARRHALTAGSTAPIGGTNPFGRGILFDGSASYFDITYTPFLDSAKVSVLAWFVATSGFNQRTLVDRGNASQGYGLHAHDGTGPAFYINAGGGLVRSSVQVNDGKLHFMVGTYDPALPSNQLKIYVDGENTGNATYTTAIDYSVAVRNFIGKLSTVWFFSGMIFQIRILARAITPKDVKEFYAERYTGILTPHRRIVRGTVTPGGFKPYWATRRSRVIGSGVI